jgi:hypothetical protein
MARSWSALIAQSKDSLWSLDLFRCESILLPSYWVLWPWASSPVESSVLVSPAITSTA